MISAGLGRKNKKGGKNMPNATMWAPCLLCREYFGSDPNKVPKLRNQPVCKDCVELYLSWPVSKDAYHPILEKE